MNPTIDLLANVIIPVFGTAAFALSQMNHAMARKWAPVLGLSAQPFWFYTQWSTAQYGVLVICALYTAIWMMSFINQWILLPHKATSDQRPELEQLLEPLTQKLIQDTLEAVRSGKIRDLAIDEIENEVRVYFQHFVRSALRLSVDHTELALLIESSNRRVCDSVAKSLTQHAESLTHPASAR